MPSYSERHFASSIHYIGNGCATMKNFSWALYPFKSDRLDYHNLNCFTPPLSLSKHKGAVKWLTMSGSPKYQKGTEENWVCASQLEQSPAPPCAVKKKCTHGGEIIPEGTALNLTVKSHILNPAHPCAKGHHCNSSHIFEVQNTRCYLAKDRIRIYATCILLNMSYSIIMCYCLAN